MIFSKQLYNRYKWPVIKTVGIYFIVSVLWISFSDYLLYSTVKNYKLLAIISASKGWFFVLGTSIMIFLLINRDMKAIERSEKLREESETGFKELSDSTTDVFFSLDPTLRYSYWNKMAEQFTGIAAASAIGKHVYELYPNLIGTDGEKILAYVLESRKQRSYINEFVFRGITYYLETNIYPSKHGLSIFIRDITDRILTDARLKESVTRLKDLFNDTVNVLASIAEKRDSYIAGHQRRVAKLATAIAREMGLPQDQIEGIEVAAILHDIGKIYVPAEILSKPGVLSENELRIVRLYPQISYEILGKIKLPWPVAQIALQHQERYDGSGYPSQYSGNNILLEARILAVADTLDALISHRPYRPSHQLSEAMDEITRNKGTLYDPNVVNACVELIKNKGYIPEMNEFSRSRASSNHKPPVKERT